MKGQPGAIMEYLRRIFGGDFSVSNDSLTIGVATVLAVQGDSERVSLTLVNLGATTLYIAPTPEVSAVRGIRLGPTGGTVAMNLFQDALLPALPWYVMGSGAGGTLFILQARRDTILPSDESGG